MRTYASCASADLGALADGRSPAIAGSSLVMSTAMTSDITYTGLPTISITNDRNPDELHAAFAEALRQGPIALGPYGPEVLELRPGAHRAPGLPVRHTEGHRPRDAGHHLRPGLGPGHQTAAQPRRREHHRLRRLVAKAFTPRAAERMRSACVDVITELVDKHIPNQLPLGAATSSPTSRGPIRYRSSARCSARRGRTGSCSRSGPMTSARPSVWTSPRQHLPSCAVGKTRGLHRADDRRIRRTSLDRRSDLRAHPRRRRRRPADPRRDGQPGRNPAQRRHRHHPQPARRRRAGACPTIRISGRCWRGNPGWRRRRSRN